MLNILRLPSTVKATIKLLLLSNNTTTHYPLPPPTPPSEHTYTPHTQHAPYTPSAPTASSVQGHPLWPRVRLCFLARTGSTCPGWDAGTTPPSLLTCTGLGELPRTSVTSVHWLRVPSPTSFYTARHYNFTGLHITYTHWANCGRTLRTA